jgi:HK97 family phage prohead protease
MAYIPIKGWASRVEEDHAGHIVLPSAYVQTIAKKGVNGPTGIKLLFAHNSEKPLGRITKLEVRNQGLWIEAEIEDGISYGKDIALAMEAAGGLSFSVGFYPVEAYFDDYERPVFTQVELTEVSVVVFPCSPQSVMVASTELDRNDDPLASLAALVARMKLTAEAMNK